MDEEHRLQALLALEKTKTHGKSDRIVAETALKQRQIAKSNFRRQIYRDSLDEILTEASIALRMKHGLPINDTSDFSLSKRK